MKPKLCYCDAYVNKHTGKPYPHRKGGGKCDGHDPEAGDEEAADRWLIRLMRRGYRNIDEALDSLQRGQAAAINRERYRT